MKPPPPMLPASGQETVRAKPTATAASTALPPLASTTLPTRVAGVDTDTTTPSAAWTTEGSSKAKKKVPPRNTRKKAEEKRRGKKTRDWSANTSPVFRVFSCLLSFFVVGSSFLFRVFTFGGLWERPGRVSGPVRHDDEGNKCSALRRGRLPCYGGPDRLSSRFFPARSESPGEIALRGRLFFLQSCRSVVNLLHVRRVDFVRLARPLLVAGPCRFRSPRLPCPSSLTEASRCCATHASSLRFCSSAWRPGQPSRKSRSASLALPTSRPTAK